MTIEEEQDKHFVALSKETDRIIQLKRLEIFLATTQKDNKEQRGRTSVNILTATDGPALLARAVTGVARQLARLG